MSLPKRLILIFTVILIAISFFSLIPLTQAASSASKPQNNQPVSSNKIQPIPASSNTNFQYIPTPNGNYQNQEVALGPVGDWFANRFHDAITFFSDPLAPIVKAALFWTQDAAYQQAEGCPFEDAQCHNDQRQQYLAGTDIAHLSHPGALDYASTLLSSSLDLPVPLDSSQYFASINPFSQAHASGVGDLAQDPILHVWQRVRNVAYAASAVIMIILGFMIMLRWKLDPRTSVTIANSLPRIIVALLLITFSLAIAGLMIDLARIVTNLATDLIPITLRGAMGLAVLGFFAVGSLVLLFTAGSTIAAGPAGLSIAFITVLLLSLILVIIILVVFIVLIYKILMRYITFIVLTIFAPFFFLIGAIPGLEGVTASWFKRQIAALLAIPAIALMVNLSFWIGFSGAGNLPNPWQTGPLPVGIVGNILNWTILSPIVGLGLFFFATKMPDIIDEMLQVKPLGARAGIGPGAILGAPIAAFGTLGTVNRGFRTFQQGGMLYGALQNDSLLGRLYRPVARFGSSFRKNPKPAFPPAAGDAWGQGLRDFERSRQAQGQPRQEGEPPDRPPGT